MTTTMQGQFSLKCLDKRLTNALILDKQKTLVGSDPKCDLVITDPSVSPIHAFISLIGTEGILVKDLGSDSGIFVNGSRVSEASLFNGDVLTIGNMSFCVESLQDDVPAFQAPEKTSPKLQVPKATLPKVDHIELPPKPGFVFIDGEYCDIAFDDSRYRPLQTLPELKVDGEYIDVDSAVEPLEIVHEVKGKRLEIINYVNGQMLDVSYLTLDNGDYYLSPKKGSKKEIQFHTVARTKIFGVQGGELRFYPTDAVTPSIDWEKITLKDPVFLTRGTEQLSIRLVSNTHAWRGIPMFYRDREFFEQGIKVFAGVLLPLLLLLFVTLPKPEEVKEEVAVIYTITKPKPIEKKPDETVVEKSEAATEKPVETPEMAHKETEQEKAKTPTMAEGSAEKKVEAKNTMPEPKKVPVTPAPTVAKPAATPAPKPAAKPAPAAAAKATPTPAPAPVKAYEFKSSVAFNSLVGSAPNINTQGGGGAARNAVKDATFNAGNSDSGPMVTGSAVGVGKFNGADSKGSGTASYGSKGLASKKGFDSSYLEPKTVVMGSMDPELLRKILREYIPQFRHCYQQELIGKSENVKGVVDLQFTIGANGKVAKYNVKVKDAQFSAKGQGCMGQVLGLIDFPKPKGGGVVDVRQPLSFLAETEKI